MKPTPPGWPRISAAVFYDDPRAAIAWLCDAFGFTRRMVVEGPDERIEHSELDFGDDGLLMVGGTDRRDWHRSPKSAGGQTAALFLYVDDIEAHYQRAVAAGAKVVSGPTVSDYGPDHWADKGYECVDPEGHHWWFAERLRNPPGQGT
jgi:uncharacterized glyoxalase superfamily protein PhnB